MIDNLISVYFGGVIIFAALFMLKPTFYATKEADRTFKMKLQDECLGPKTYAFVLLFMTLAFGVFWPYVLVALLKDGRATKNDIKEIDK